MLEHFAGVRSKVIWGQIFITSFSGYLQGVWGSNSVTTNLMTRGTFCRGQVKGHVEVKFSKCIFWTSVRGTGLKLHNNKLTDLGNILEHCARVMSKVIWGQIVEFHFLDICKRYGAQTWWQQTSRPGEHYGTSCIGQVKGHLGSNLRIEFFGHLLGVRDSNSVTTNLVTRKTFLEHLAGVRYLHNTNTPS